MENQFQKLRATSRLLRKSSADVRCEHLRALRRSVVAHTPEIENALAADLGKNPAMANAEVAAVLADLDEALEAIGQWMVAEAIQPKRFITATASVVAEPKGVVAIFGAWNFPFNLLFQPLVAALAAGNAVILKPNELAPATSSVAAAIVREGFDPDMVFLAEGGVDVAQQILALPLDHIFFTGSPAVGRLVMAAAAKNLTPVTLELGGKNPVIVDASADLGTAAREIATARCINAGQLCLAPDHVWVERAVFEEFTELLANTMRAIFYPKGEVNADLLGRIVNRANFDRVTAHVEDALRRGGRIVAGGGSDASRLTIYPAIMADVPLDATIMQDEIFGPILPVFPFDDEAEVFDSCRSRGVPLALYIYSRDLAAVERWLAEIPSGGATVNGVISHAMETTLPFGGAGQSGMGRYHGIHGFFEFSHLRSVLRIS